MISSLGSSGGSAAQWRQMFSSVDSNSDSSLSMDELLSALQSTSQGQNDKNVSSLTEALFSAMDSDEDGAVTASEFSSFGAKFSAETAGALLMAQQQPPPRPNAEDMMAETDADGDGSISKDELAAVLEQKAGGRGSVDGPSAEEMFDQMDADKDGAVSMDELSAFAEKAPPSRGGGAQASAVGTSSTSSSQSYDPLDTNQDGVVSLEERMAGTGLSDSRGSRNLSSQTLAALISSLNEVAA